MRWARLGLILLALVIVGIGGVLTGGRLADRRAALDEERRLDEHVGLGERTGMTGDLALSVRPLNLIVRQGQDVKIDRMKCGIR